MEPSALKLATKFTPHRSAFETAIQAGFRNAEFWLDAALLAHWSDLAQLAQAYPFGYALHAPNRADLSDATVRHLAELAETLQVHSVIMHQPTFDRCHERLWAINPDIPVGVENHRLNPAGFQRWAENSPGLTLDVEHIWMFTIPDASLEELLRFVRKFLTEFSHKLRHVHLPGYTPGYEEHRPMYCNRDLCRGLFELLTEFRFQGLVVSEVNEEYQNIQDLTMDRLLFERWCVERNSHSLPQRMAI